MDHTRTDRIRAWADTYKKSQQCTETKQSILVYGLTHYKAIKGRTPYSTACKVTVSNADTLVKAKEFVEAGYNPMILNMACFTTPGGGVDNGARAQEEELFRRTTLSQTLDKTKLERGSYPLHNAIYSPKILIIKDEDYVDMMPVPVGCISVSAPKMPMVAIHADAESYASRLDRCTMSEKIEMIFLTGILYGHDSLVLGALGCGAYRNPVTEVRDIFLEMLMTYKEYFKAIDFAVYSRTKGDRNFEVFCKLPKLIEEYGLADTQPDMYPSSDSVSSNEEELEVEKTENVVTKPVEEEGTEEEMEGVGMFD